MVKTAFSFGELTSQSYDSSPGSQSHRTARSASPTLRVCQRLVKHANLKQNKILPKLATTQFCFLQNRFFRKKNVETKCIATMKMQNIAGRKTAKLSGE